VAAVPLAPNETDVVDPEQLVDRALFFRALLATVMMTEPIATAMTASMATMMNTRPPARRQPS